MSMTGATQMTRIQLPYPHKGQQSVIKSAKRHNWLSAGRRWRKTSMLATVIMIEAAINKRGDYMWAAPTFDQTRIGMVETRRAIGGIADFNLSRMVATLPNSSRIFFRSLDDPDNARGYTLDGICIDECADIKLAAWYEVLRPTLIDTGGWSWGIGTPKGRNWFFVEHMRAALSDESMSWQAPTVGCRLVDGQLIRSPHPLENPHVAFEEIERLFAIMPERAFRQEILAEFLDNEGVVFRNITECTNENPGNPDDHKGHYIVIGGDWGQKVDYTCFSVGCADCRKELEIDRFKQIDYETQKGRLKALVERWQPNAVWLELNSIGLPIFQSLEADGLASLVGFDTTATSKPRMIQNLQLAFERKEWGFIDDPTWRGELEAFEQTISAHTGRSAYRAPDGMHDDTVMSRGIMVWAATNRVSLFL